MVHRCRLLILLVGLLSVLTAAACAEEAGQASATEALPAVRFAPAFPHLRFQRPLFLTHAGDGSDTLFVVEQDGRVLHFPNDPQARQAEVAIDLRRKVRREHNEEGLLGLAFHPSFKENRQVFLHYSASNPRRNVLARFRAAAEGYTIDPATEEVLLEVEQPWGNHNGGMIAFGPDGLLYVALGDGGAAGDPHNAAQRLDTLLGKLLRIDVDRREAGRAYAIPPDNPFVDRPEARPEIWAYGLRNVWRFSFDRADGDLWAGDVGQNQWEEIDLIKRGGNYGWRVLEGTRPFNVPRQGVPEGLIAPVVEHRHGQANSITGGYVYRGQAAAGMAGAYVYGDYVTGLIWALRYDGRRVTAQRQIGQAPTIASFGEDREGELYLCSFDGKIYRMQAAGEASATVTAPD